MKLWASLLAEAIRRKAAKQGQQTSDDQRPA